MVYNSLSIFTDIRELRREEKRREKKSRKNEKNRKKNRSGHVNGYRPIEKWFEERNYMDIRT